MNTDTATTSKENQSSIVHCLLKIYLLQKRTFIVSLKLDKNFDRLSKIRATMVTVQVSGNIYNVFCDIY